MCSNRELRFFEDLTAVLVKIDAPPAFWGLVDGLGGGPGAVGPGGEEYPGAIGSLRVAVP